MNVRMRIITMMLLSDNVSENESEDESDDEDESDNEEQVLDN